MDEAQLKDVFLSYSSADQAFVDRIRDRLGDARITSFYAPSDIAQGVNFVSELETGLTGTQVLLVFLSPAAMESFWVRQEWTGRLVQMSQDRSRRLVPVVLPGAEWDRIPVTLRTMNLLDFRQLDLADPVDVQTAGDRIVHAIRIEVPDPAIAALRVAFVVFAMTATELDGCLDGSVFDDPRVAPIDRARFNGLLTELADHGITDLRPHYRPARDHWRPLMLPAGPNDGDTNVRAVIQGIVNRLNTEFRSRPGKPILHPQFFSADFLAQDDDWRRRTWSELDALGCVLVIDAISMYHPLLAALLAQSEFGSNPRVSIVVVSPLGPQAVPLNQRLERELEPRLQRAFDRYQTQLDAMCEFGVGSGRALNRWLFSALPQALSVFNGAVADPDLRAQLSEQVGVQPNGIGLRIFGKRR